jgi:hypothetical protein
MTADKYQFLIEQDRADERWRSEHPWMIRLIHFGLIAFSVGAWWLVIRALLWLVWAR